MDKDIDKINKATAKTAYKSNCYRTKEKAKKIKKYFDASAYSYRSNDLKN